MDGCAGNQLILRDRLINRQVAFLFSLPLTKSEREAIITSQSAWLTWRGKYCDVVADIYSEASELPLQVSSCLASADQMDSASLWSLYTYLYQGDAQRSLWP